MKTWMILLLALNGILLAGCGGESSSSDNDNTQTVMPTANFTVTTPAVQGQTVTFTNTTADTNQNTTYSWDFGDESTVQTEQNPTHIYSFEEPMKFFDVTLTVTYGEASSSITKTIEVYTTTFSDTQKTSMKTQVDTVFNGGTINDKAGMSVAVFKTGYPVWTYALGKADEGRDMTPETPSVLYSVTKTMVSAGILKLVEDGALNLADTLETALPNLDYTNLGNKVNKDATVAQLLKHTSGIQDFNLDTSAITNMIFNGWSPDKMIAAIDSDFTNVGTHFYSNANYVLLGMMIEAKTGKDLYAAYQDLVADIHISGNLLPRQDFPSNAAQPYDDQSVQGGTQQFGNLVTANSYFIQGMGYSTWAAAGMVMTAENVARWGLALYGDTGNSILESNTDLINSADNADNYGYGISKNTMNIDDANRNVYGHGGGGHGYLTRLCYSGSPKFASIAILTNSNNSNPANTNIQTFTSSDLDGLCEDLFNVLPSLTMVP